MTEKKNKPFCETRVFTYELNSMMEFSVLLRDVVMKQCDFVDENIRELCDIVGVEVTGKMTQKKVKKIKRHLFKKGYYLVIDNTFENKIYKTTLTLKKRVDR